MIKSMTGFAALSREDEIATVGVTIKAVNHRYLDVQLRLPQSLSSAEARLRGLVQRHVARGRIEIGLTLQPRRPAAIEVELNESFVDAVTAALDRARERGLVTGHLGPGDLLRFPQALAIRERAPDVDVASSPALQATVESTFDDTLRELDTMRVREGAMLREDLDGRLAALAEMIERITAAAEDGRAGFQAKLARRVSELSPDLQGDPAAVAQEIVRLVARSDISEEVVRFRAHLQHWASLVDSPEPCGRKLDFLLQEMNREVNTIGAKAEGTRLSALIVSTKAELEKIREQVQNIE